jgi:hypothetical protein
VAQLERATVPREHPPAYDEQEAVEQDEEHHEAGRVELAMSRESLTGFQAWLEARPPGTDWSR